MKINMIKKWSSILLGIFILYSCNSSKADKKEVASEEKIKPIKTQLIKTDTVNRVYDYIANLIASDEVYIVPVSPGRIINITKEIGDRVQKGELLIEMDSTQFKQANLQFKNLSKDFVRFDSLISFGGITKQQYDQMKTQLEIAKANVDFLKINTKIMAPFNGIITSKLFENGELYSGAPNTTAGKAAVVVLQKINPIKAIISISEKLFPVIKTGSHVDILSDLYPNEVFKGNITRIHPTINPSTKTFNAEIEIVNNNELLRPGMLATVEIQLGQAPAILIPSNVVLQQMGTNIRYVFFNRNGKAERVNVKIGNRYDDLLEIISDNINVNDEIIISGHNNLQNGDIVKKIN